MNQNASEYRAVASSYIVLCGIWVLLALMYITLEVFRPGNGVWHGAVVAGGTGGMFALWLRGFRVRVSDLEVSYRNGLYRERRVPLGSIAQIEYRWLDWRVLTRLLRVPRFALLDDQGKTLLFINPKPFRRDLFEGLSAAVTACRADRDAGRP